jgi:hypothetical protein
LGESGASGICRDPDLQPDAKTLHNICYRTLGVDGSSDFHFLGAIIIHGRRTNPSEPNVYEVIDGQQRITTIFLYLCAIIRNLCKQEDYAEAAGLFLKYLVIGRETALVSNSRLQPCKDDRAQLNYVIDDILADPAFAERLAPFKYKPMPAAGIAKGRLRNNYRAALRFFRSPGSDGRAQASQRLVQVST